MSNEAFWESLLDALDLATSPRGRPVVPVLGRDVVVVKTEGGERPYHLLVAAEVARVLKLAMDDMPPDFDLHSVERRARLQRIEIPELRGCAFKVHQQLSAKVEPGEALQLLAAIPAFRLLITTAWDSLLERSIEASRGRAPVSGAFSIEGIEAPTDYDEADAKAASAFVYHLFGRISRFERFGMTESEILEEVHNLTAYRATRWSKLSHELQRSHLLLIGLKFPDWLARFIVKLGRPDPLWQPRSCTEFIVEAGTLDKTFLDFLHSFPGVPQLYDGSALTFARELSERWRGNHPSLPPPASRPLAGAPAPAERGSIFISYASQDRAAALTLANQLKDQGLEVWIDDQEIRSGDDYLEIIYKAIDRAAAFVALLSCNTSREVPSRYRDEWNRAHRSMGKRTGLSHLQFIHPVIVDSTPYQELQFLPSQWSDMSKELAPGGVPTPKLVDTLRDIQRTIRKLQAS